MPAASSNAGVGRFRSTLSAPSFARRHVQREVSTLVTPACLSEIILLTSELVANAVEHACSEEIEVSVFDNPALTRVEVSSPGEDWGPHVELKVPGLNEVGGRGLFLVDRLSDRWGIDDDQSTVWFEFDHYAPED